jgi:diguanylate cyclase (GGDEF)-like protein
MRDAPRRRPAPRPSKSRRPLIAAALRALAVAAAVAGVSLLAAPAGFWACVPAALLLAASARGLLGEAAATVAVVAAASVPQAAGAPSPLLGLAVAAASVAVLHGMRTRLEGEREAMRRSALHDPLTGLCNRRGLDERITYEVARHARERRRFAVIAIDLDGFKDVNDRFGHAAGDEVLRDVAGALADAVREQDTVARLGGDEFCVLAPETDRGGAAKLGMKLDRAIRRVTTGLEALSGSVGVAVFPDDGGDALTVLEAADDAQVDAKRRSRSGGRQRAA